MRKSLYLSSFRFLGEGLGEVERHGVGFGLR